MNSVRLALSEINKLELLGFRLCGDRRVSGPREAPRELGESNFADQSGTRRDKSPGDDAGS